ncbi:MAG TPA: WecB/TagA/CpsF family glycosyltransferase [Verrucomicrobiae bacterium]
MATFPFVMCGVPFDQVTMDESVEIVQKMIRSRRPHHIVTANVDFLVQSLHDEKLHQIFLDADLLLCDGTPLVWASRLLGHPLPERVAGSDLVPRLMELAEKKNYRIFLLGGSPEANEAAVKNLEEQHPRLIIAGHYSPPFAPLKDMDHEGICQRIREADADILLVSFGCPKQEKWISMNYQALGVPVVIGVGAVIDFYARRVKRAPVWMRESGLEWVYRLSQEPRRLFRRYAVDLYGFVTAMLMEKWHDQHPPEIPLLHGPIEVEETKWRRIHIPARLDSNLITDHAVFWHHVSHHDYLLNLENVEFIDAVGAGMLIRLHQRLKQQGHALLLLNPSPTVLITLKRRRLLQHLTVVKSEEEAAQKTSPRAEIHSLPMATPLAA